MTEKSFWTSEQLTSIWMRIFTSISQRRMTYWTRTRPESLTPEEGRGAVIEVGGAGYLTRLHQPPLPSLLLANMQSLEKKMDDLHPRLSYQCDLKNLNILCFSESWLNKDMVNINLAVLLYIGRTERLLWESSEEGVCIFLLKTTGTRSLILRKFLEVLLA